MCLCMMKVYLKKGNKSPSFFHKKIFGSAERKKSRSKCFYQTKWVLTTFLDCYCSKLSYKCHTAEWYISAYTSTTPQSGKQKPSVGKS